MQSGFQSIFFWSGGADGGASILRHHRNQNLLFACVLALIFGLLIPITEWPDAMDHLSRKATQQTIYPPDLSSLLASLPTPILNGEHRFFADHYMYQPQSRYFLVNLERLPFVLTAIVALYLLASKVDIELLLFCPPLIFSLAAPSQEVIAIYILLVAAIISHKHVTAAVLLAVLSIAIDRSMAPSAAFLVLYAAVPLFRAIVLERKAVAIAGVLLLIGASLVSPLDLISGADNTSRLILGLTVEDIRDGAQHGGQKFLALAASTMGLYGWMSIRPFPLWIYYPAIMLLFAVGFLASQPSQQSLFLALLLLSCGVLWLMPPLSQARYFPLLTVVFWGIVLRGALAVKIKPIALYILVIMASAAGCVASLANAL